MSLQPLDKSMRKKLECAIQEARDVVEAAARAAVQQLGVGESKAYEHLSDSEKELRRTLRTHGRQLGDERCSNKETQRVDHLVDEVAYQHWHRMLFARFLAENDLLMYPNSTVSVSLEECNELALEEGAKSGWELAARFATRMLPQIFKTDSPVFQLTLPPERQQRLEQILADLPVEVFRASDSLGWVYQFWQTKKKKAINDSEVKIGARELPAVTQLFTEPYMVAFLLDNALGAWWAARHLTAEDLAHAKDEEELRKKASLPGVPLEYLRFVKEEEGKWEPASGSFDRWPETLAELKTMDPCCGSGHFLVAALLMLVPMRMEMEGLSAQEAVDAVLHENIYGLELDQRCVELAAFALALTAWKYPGANGFRPLPELHLACSGLSVSAAKEEWKQLGLGKKNLSIALDWMYDIFQDAPILGSLINPAKTEASDIVPWEELSAVLAQALVQERSDEQQEAAIVAQGLAKAATLLAGQYHWVITNVPYLASGKQSAKLHDFCERHYPTAKNDLATVFLERCLELCTEGGTSSIVLPQNWLFLISYRKFREKLLKNETWHLIARLGEGGFDSSAAAGAFVAMISISRGNISGRCDEPFSEEAMANLIRGVDVSESRAAVEKAVGLLTAEIKSVSQAKQLQNPDACIILEDIEQLELLGAYASAYQGLASADDSHFRSFFWERTLPNKDWIFQLSTISKTAFSGARERILYWQEGKGEIVNSLSARVQGTQVWGKVGIHVSQMRNLSVTPYTGECWDTNSAPIIPKNSAHLLPIWCFCSSPKYNKAVRQVNQKLSVTNATLVKVPFDLEHWTEVAKEKYPNGLPKPYSDDPTQWIFHGHPCGSVVWDEEKKRTDHGPLRTDATVLQVAVARLLGYRWPAEQDPAMELAEEQRIWVKRCEALLPLADQTGIVCIPPVRGQTSAADRLLNLLVAAYGESWNNDKLGELLKEAGHAGKTLDSWLRDKFFSQHCKIFHQTPFIWHIWDGLYDGFAALVNYHKLDYKNLEILIYTHLGDWIGRQKDDCGKIDGAAERLAAAENLQKQLKLILEGEKPYDIFVRWKPKEKQPIGWNPDLNDGVRLNIRPFLSVAGTKVKKGGGVLRDRPAIKWEKDRGKDVESAPWFFLFRGERINDHHLTLEEKQAARERVEREIV